MPEQRPIIAALNARLPRPERDVLALLAEPGLKYKDIGEILGVPPRSVAAMAAAARIRIADGLYALRLFDELSPECWEVAADVSAQLDHEPEPEAKRASTHATGCDSCRRARDAQSLVAREYEAWRPEAPSEALRESTLRRAVRLLGLDDADVSSE